MWRLPGTVPGFLDLPRPAPWAVRMISLCRVYVAFAVRIISLYRVDVALHCRVASEGEAEQPAAELFACPSAGHVPTLCVSDQARRLKPSAPVVPTRCPTALCRVRDPRRGSSSSPGLSGECWCCGHSSSSITNPRPATPRNTVLSLKHNCSIFEEEVIHSWVQRGTKPSSGEQVPCKG